MMILLSGPEFSKRNRPTIVLGLSHKNLELLKEGKPVLVKGDEHGLNLSVDVLIFSGETEAKMALELVELVGPNTKVDIDPRIKKEMT